MQVNLLNQARDLLSKAEKMVDPSTKKALCDNALEILCELMEDDPSENEIIIIKNVRKSFARSLVSQICSMNMNDIETTKFFFFNFVLKFPIEVLELKDENPDFDKKISWLADQFRADLA